MKRVFSSIFILILFNAVSSGAQTKGQNVFTLEQSIQIALEKNYDVRVNKQRILTSDAQVRAAFGSYLPSADVSLGYQRQFGLKSRNYQGLVYDVPADQLSNYSLQATAQYLIFDGFNRDALYSQAEKTLDANRMTAEQTRDNIRIEVIRNYINVIKNGQIVKIRRQNIEEGRKTLEMIQAQFKAGTISITPVYAQEAALGTRELELLQAENDVNIAKANLLVTMGLEADMEATFLETSLANDVGDDDMLGFRKRIGGEQSLIKRAIDSRQDIRALEASLEASRAYVRSTMSGYYPKLYAQGGWMFSNNQFNNFGERGFSYLGLSLQVPVFEQFRTNAQKQTAELQLVQNEMEIRRLENVVRSNIQLAILNLDGAEKGLEISRRALRSAEMNFRSVEESFKVGTANSTDLTTANAQLITAQVNRVTSVYNYLQIQKEVLYAIGELK